jgi:hypothetical protein
LLARWDFTESVAIVAGHAGVGDLFVGIGALHPAVQGSWQRRGISFFWSLAEGLFPALVALGRLSNVMHVLRVTYGLQSAEISPLRFVSIPIEYRSTTGIETKSGPEDGATRAATKRPCPQR